MSISISNRRSFCQSLASLGGIAMAGPVSEAVSQESDRGSSVTSVPTFRDTFGLVAKGKKIPVIFDTDIGSDIDDTWALLYLIRCPELDVKLVAADAHQGLYRARLAAKFLEACGCTDIPIAIGDGDPKSAGHQRDWLGDYDLDRYPGTVHENAVDSIIRTVHGSPDPVTLVCIGGVPNIAKALQKDPSICGNARFVGMHGSIRKGYGNSSTPVAEANVRTDPAALRATFAAAWECSVTPLDTCGIVTLGGKRYRKLLDSKDAGLVALFENYRAWLKRVPWLKVKPNPNQVSSTLFDLVACYMAHSEELLKMETLPIAVTDSGMTEIRKGAPEVRCAMAWKDLDAFYDLMVERLMA